MNAQSTKLISDISTLERRNLDFLHLTINENRLSETASKFLGSKLSERYYFGGGKNGVVDFTSFTFVGMPEIERLKNAAEDALKRMSGGEVVNTDCLSGIHAMMCAILSLTEVGDAVMSLDPADGGHSATRGIITGTGRRHVFAEFDRQKQCFKVEETAVVIRNLGVRVLYIDASDYINPHNLKELRERLGSKICIIYDASHTLGLILGGRFQSPFSEGADVICANTHKTFPGPHKGLIIFKDKDVGERANAKIIGTYYSTSHLNHSLALYVTLLEWEEFGAEYSKQVIQNSRALGKALRNRGYELRHSNTGEISENEQVHLFIDRLGDRVELYTRLVHNHISTNVKDTLGGRAYLRLGTQEITRRGMKEMQMVEIANLLHRTLNGERTKDQVISFTKSFQSIEYSFDGQTMGSSLA